MSLPRSPLPDIAGETARHYKVNSGWHRQATARLAVHWLLKFTASVGFLGVFFTGYFLLLKFPVFEPTAMPVIAFDRWVPFQAGALWAYVSLWVYVQLAPALLLRRSDVLAYGKAVGLMSGIGFAIFFFFPTTLASTDIDWAQHAAFQTLKEVDASGNACPSLHVAFALFTACSLSRTLREIGAPRTLLTVNALWCAVIIYSTVATRQHVVLDVVAGVLLALGVWLMYTRSRYFAAPFKAE